MYVLRSLQVKPCRPESQIRALSYVYLGFPVERIAVELSSSS